MLELILVMAGLLRAIHVLNRKCAELSGRATP